MLDEAGKSTTHLNDRIAALYEPIYRYCFKRLGRSEDAEDLAQEILADVVHGLKRRRIESFEAWVWTLARNHYRRRYAKETATPKQIIVSYDDMPDMQAGVEEQALENEAIRVAYQSIVGISEKYRRVLVEYYIHGKSYLEISRALSIPMSSVKWRIHEGRIRFQERWNETMETKKRIYDQIEWVVMCSGSMNPKKYLGRQINRAIADAAYEKPMTVEEISKVTGIPCMYIEDELEQMLYGEALTETGGKYAANFIIQRLDFRNHFEDQFRAAAKVISAKILDGIRGSETEIRSIGFYRSDTPLDRLMWVLVPRIISIATGRARRSVDLSADKEFPLRKDGGRGWFIVLEGSWDSYRDNGGQNGYTSCPAEYAFRYYWLARYFDEELNSLLVDLSRGSIINLITSDGSISSVIDDELLARCVACGITQVENGRSELTIPVYTGAQYKTLMSVLESIAEMILPDLHELTERSYEYSRANVPPRLHDQITGNMHGYLYDLVGMVIGMYEERGIMTMESVGASVELTAEL